VRCEPHGGRLPYEAALIVGLIQEPGEYDRLYCDFSKFPIRLIPKSNEEDGY